MRHGGLLAWIAPAALVATAAGQETPATARVELRVMAATPGRAIVDRGSADGLAVGDRVELRPRGGAPLRGIVADVRERGATVELDDRRALVAAGTRGDATVPASRLPKQEPPAPATPPQQQPQQPSPAAPAKEPATAAEPAAAPSGAGEAKKWTNRDDGFQQGQPLLAGMAALRPQQRPARVDGRVWALADFTSASDGGWSSSFARGGVDLRAENLFGDGGTLRADLETNYDTEPDDGHGTDFLARRLSYTMGGTRFDAQRVEIGRFLQHAMPELGYLDGLEWGRRLADGDRIGVSAGFMPEPDDDFSTLDDVQAAISYEWVNDPGEQLTLAGALQQTWHEGQMDRSLLVGRARWLPSGNWDVSASTWVDFYDGEDDAKDQPVEVTQAIVSIVRSFDGGGSLALTGQHVAFPELDRHGEFLPLDATALARTHLDRIALSGRTTPGGAFALHGDLAAFHDEEGNGGSLEAGFDVPLPWFEDARLDVTGFLSLASFADVYGGRVGASDPVGDYPWECFYELANHRQAGFSASLDDLVQHRLYFSQSFYEVGGMRLSARVELRVYDDEHSVTGGFSLERSF